MKPLSLTTRISLSFALASGLVLLSIGYFLAQVVDHHFEEGDRHELTGKLELIQNLFSQTVTPRDVDRLPRLLHDALVGHHGMIVAVSDRQGRLVFATPDAAFPPTLGAACQQRLPACQDRKLLHWQYRDVPYRGLAVLLPAGNGQRYSVLLGLDIKRHEAFMNTFRIGLALAIALAALATAGLGWAVTRWGLTPLRQVTQTVSGVSAEHLTERLSAANLPAELVPLATAFNAMLARLDESFRRLSEFSSNIAHELRTPISNLMTQTQVALSSARDKEAYQEILYSSLEEYERMAQMVSDMLYLAQTDNGLLQPGSEVVDLEQETQDLFDYFEAWAEERAVTLSRSGTARVPGDKLMLRRALSNLLANAIRHTPAGQSVHVALDTRGGEATVKVQNTGDTIPATHLPKLFDRFYRVDASRQRSGDGAGLGLAIVKSIVEAHEGSIRVTSADNQTTFVLKFSAHPDT